MPITVGTVAAGYGILLGTHIVNEVVVDRVPFLRNLCRGVTQKTIATMVSDSVRETIRTEMDRVIARIAPEKQEANPS